MPKLVLANPHSRAMTARPDDLPPKSRRGCDVEAARMLWSLAADDIAVIPGPVDKDFLDYLADLLGISVPTVLSLQDYRGTNWYPHDNAELVTEIRNRIAASGFEPREWTVSCYIRDRDIAHWERLLGLDTDAAPYAQDLASLINSKAVFRALALAAGTPVPEGYVVDAGPELVHTVIELIDRTGSVIVKQDQNSGGLGNTLITTDTAVIGVGAAQVLRLDADSDLLLALPHAMHENDLVLGDSLDLPRGMAPAKFIVEVYQSDTRSLSSELYIPRIGAPVLRNYGEMRMEPMWSGFVLPPQDLPATVHAQFCADSQQIALSAQRLGYYGLINIDAIVGADHRLTYTEFNGRAGGVTNIDTIARRLLGEDYLHSHVLLTRNGLRVPRITEFVEHLARVDIRFDATRGSGIVVGTDDPVTGAIEYVAIGRDRAEAERLEQQLATLAAELVTPDD
ncbi:peptide ligase PGM1-related protein [Nocardia sp. CA-128927]|uniref:preATP grasp domain-containing protein n=1 Tax=Nocardia sp. CA-128927 TaxID=3239975 RepID=UPI003D97DC95